jgi:hypothetical protein
VAAGGGVSSIWSTGLECLDVFGWSWGKQPWRELIFERAWEPREAREEEYTNVGRIVDVRDAAARCARAYA